MSNQTNTNLYERAAELLDTIQSHPSGYDKALERAIDNNDLDSVKYWIGRIEGELSQMHFAGKDIIIW